MAYLMWLKYGLLLLHCSAACLYPWCRHSILPIILSGQQPVALSEKHIQSITLRTT